MEFKVDVEYDFDIKNVLNTNDLDKAQEKFVELVKEKSDSYVPWDTGDLRKEVEAKKDMLIYQPHHGGSKSYAARNYYTNRGMGKEGKSNGGKRGPKWDEAMWADCKDEIVREIANILGGEPV